MSATEEILSVGIDIGTTTTSVVISKLKIKNVASGFVVPKIEIIGKKLIYRSDVYFTPLKDEKTIDFKGIEDIVKREYEKAKVDPSEIKTGAVIITGDTARKENAESVLAAVSRMAGSFVVATAGPQLEAYIAGLGSGAAALSAQKQNRIANADIGGGTTNISIFEDGKLALTLCADIGGRLIRFKSRTAIVESFIRGGAAVARNCHINLEKGRPLGTDEIFRIGNTLAEALISILNGAPTTLAKELAIGKLTEQDSALDEVMFSGGVGRLFYEEENNSDIDILTRYGDLGPALAICLKKRIEGLKARIIKPDETIYATVIGAGVHTTELSGSTIFVSDPRILPFRDLPAIRIDESNLNYAEDILKNILFKAKQFVTAESSRIPAVVVPKAAGNSFKKIKSLAEVLANAVKRLGKTGPLVVICEDDIGKALGSILKNMIGERPIVSIDQITMKEGDYIDIGEPLYNGGVVPVVIKTLVFSHS